MTEEVSEDRATLPVDGEISPVGVDVLAEQGELDDSVVDQPPYLVEDVARKLDADYDIEIVEMHHRRKVDAPSGTALALGQAAAAGRGVDLGAVSQRVRDGHTGARRRGDIGFATLRGGDVAGEHSVIFAGESERIELSQKAADRIIFARGALTAALWLRDKPPGLYDMADVLGLRSTRA